MSKIFPLLDYLYIFQLLEYDRTALLKWFLNYPLKRNLQKKNHLDFTLKIQLLAVLSSFIMLATATLTALIFLTAV
jgi:hypothetical protein